MFRIISTLASNVLTISDLEKRINNWRLDNSSDKAMYDSVTTLFDLLQRSMMNKNFNQAIDYPELFRVAVGRIQRIPNLPHFIYKSLNESRLRIRDTDEIDELIVILIGALNPYVGFKQRKGIRDSGIPNHSKVFAIEYKPQNVAPPILHDSCSPPPKTETKNKNKGNQNQNSSRPNSAGNTPNVKRKGNLKGKAVLLSLGLKERDTYRSPEIHCPKNLNSISVASVISVAIRAIQARNAALIPKKLR
jgi:hypothetical protein